MFRSLDGRLPIMVNHDTDEVAILIFRIGKTIQTLLTVWMVGVRASVGVNLHARGKYERPVAVQRMNVDACDVSYHPF